MGKSGRTPPGIGPRVRTLAPKECAQQAQVYPNTSNPSPVTGALKSIFVKFGLWLVLKTAGHYFPCCWHLQHDTNIGPMLAAFQLFHDETHKDFIGIPNYGVSTHTIVAEWLRSEVIMVYPLTWYESYGMGRVCLLNVPKGIRSNSTPPLGKLIFGPQFPCYLHFWLSVWVSFRKKPTKAYSVSTENKNVHF